jgi:reverse gyrase
MSVKIGTIKAISETVRSVTVDDKTFYLNQDLFKNVFRTYRIGDSVEVEYQGTKVKNFVRKNRIAE